MKATQQLIEEHQGISMMLVILEEISRRLESGEEVNVDHFPQILEFLTVFVDQCHHVKEEELLFPEAEKISTTDERELIQILLKEHEVGRSLIKDLKEGTGKYIQGDIKAKDEIVESSLAYSDLLKRHIGRENNLFFPGVDKQLSQEQQDKLFEEFEKIETERIGLGKHEQFHQLLGNLKQYYLLS